MQDIFSFLKKHWRELAVLIMFLILQSEINDAKQTAFQAYDSASEAASNAQDASNYSSDASDYAQQAADSASYCEYLN